MKQSVVNQSTAKPSAFRRLTDIDWTRWQATDPATLVFVIRDGEILLINKKTGLGKGKVTGTGGKV
ncbi:MAG: hypothetical protein L3J56_13415, partial [Bacteroidales bacterium]|nr:hypothetical protein [Bacteroidales bacterium]